MVDYMTMPYHSIFSINVSFSFLKIIPKSTQMYTLYTNMLFYITFTMFRYIGQGQFL